MEGVHILLMRVGACLAGRRVLANLTDPRRINPHASGRPRSICRAFGLFLCRPDHPALLRDSKAAKVAPQESGA